ncbi:MAG: hypothetical protein ACKO40_07485 [Planctomycetaceae bacterium]
MAGGKQQMIVGHATIRRAGGFLASVAAGVVLLYLRDPHSLLVPTLYTEDGVWMARLFNAGFWHTLIHAKGGETPYFVTLNILLLQAAKTLNAACFGESLANLPRFVSALAMTFYATLALLVVRLLRRWLSPAAGCLLWALVIFMPLGGSSFEVLGRVSNIGYGMLCLCACLLVWRRTADRGRPGAIMAADAGLLLCATTNPLCYPVILADYACRGWRLWTSREGVVATVRQSAAGLSAAALGTVLAASVVAMTQLEPRPTEYLLDAPDTDELIETVVARPILYPLAFPWYRRLDESTAVAGYASLATVATRPGLTCVLDHYRTTLLDRYYYGTSLVVVVAVCVAASAGLRGVVPVRRRVAAAVLATLLVTYASHLGDLVEFRSSRWHDPPLESFASAVASAAAVAPADADRVRVPLHPRPWRARFPATNVRATLMAVMPDTVIR